MASKLPSSFRVLIIGGGPAGLLTAQALKKHGVSSTVFEQDAALDARPRDWNFGIYWAQAPLGDCMSEEMAKEIIEHAQVDSRPISPDDFMPIYDGQTGLLMKAIPAPNNIRLHRRRFLRILSKDIDIKYGKKVKDVKSDGKQATAYFEDGTVENGDLLIGAEGAHSKVRDYLLGEEDARLIPSPITATATLGKLPAETAIAFRNLHPRYAVIYHPHNSFSWIGVHEAYDGMKPDDMTFMVIQSWIPSKSYPSTLPPHATSAQIHADLKARAKYFAEPFRAVFENLPEDVRYYHNQLSYWIPKAWDNRNSTITLIGDAAHPMTFHRGQGLNNSIHDVATLVSNLIEHGLNPGISLYENEMQTRGRDAVISSNENSMLTHDWNTLLQSPLFKIGLTRPAAQAMETTEVNGE